MLGCFLAVEEELMSPSVQVDLVFVVVVDECQREPLLHWSHLLPEFFRYEKPPEALLSQMWLLRHFFSVPEKNDCLICLYS